MEKQEVKRPRMDYQRTYRRSVSRQIASRNGSATNSSYEKSRPPFSARASNISRWSLFWTSGLVARRLRMRESAFEVVSNPAVMKVLVSGCEHYMGLLANSKAYARHLQRKVEGASVTGGYPTGT